MRFKTFFSVWLLLTVSVLSQGKEQKPVLLDRIEATVNGSLITRQDVLRAMLFFPVLQERGQTTTQFHRMVLEELIDYKVVSLEYSDELVLREEDYETVQLEVIARMGSLNAIYPVLRRLGMSWNDFKAFIRERVIFEKVIAERLQNRAVISYREIESFYRGHYLPLQETLGLTAKSLVEMTSQIEGHLAKKKMATGLQDWLKDIRSTYQIEYLEREE